MPTKCRQSAYAECGLEADREDANMSWAEWLWGEDRLDTIKTPPPSPEPTRQSNTYEPLAKHSSNGDSNVRAPSTNYNSDRSANHPTSYHGSESVSPSAEQNLQSTVTGFFNNVSIGMSNAMSTLNQQLNSPEIAQYAQLVLFTVDLGTVLYGMLQIFKKIFNWLIGDSSSKRPSTNWPHRGRSRSNSRNIFDPSVKGNQHSWDSSYTW